MLRVVKPLRSAGGINRRSQRRGQPSLEITGTRLQGVTHVLETPSAQVKTALLLAGLSSEEPTTIIEPVSTRDHTERMLGHLGILYLDGHSITMALPCPQGIGMDHPRRLLIGGILDSSSGSASRFLSIHSGSGAQPHTDGAFKSS